MLSALVIGAVTTIFIHGLAFYRESRGYGRELKRTAFFASIGILALLTFFLSEHLTSRMVLLTGCVLLHSLRHVFSIWMFPKKDFPEGGTFSKLFRRYTRSVIFTLLVALPIIVTNAFGGPALGVFGYFAVALFLAGFSLEVAADLELARFRSEPRNAGHLLTSGPFTRSRHPDYFGEIVLWVGLALLALPVETWGILAMFSPLLLWIFFRLGRIPQVEEELRAYPEFEAQYLATRALLPLPRRPLSE